MSHHESGPNPELREAFKQMFGEFPEGRLNPQDEGAIPMAISTEGEVVKISFPRPVQWIGFSAEQAADLAMTILKHSKKISKKPVILTLP